MDLVFNVDPSEFHERKRRRIANMSNAPASGPKPAPTSAPGVHEIATFLPGRLEFEHELDNEAEDLVKDLEFGICLEYGGDEIPLDVNDVDVKAKERLEEERRRAKMGLPPLAVAPSGRDGSVDTVDSGAIALSGGLANGHENGINGHHSISHSSSTPDVKPDHLRSHESKAMKSDPGPQSAAAEANQEVEEPVLPPPDETRTSIAFKLTLLEMYAQRVEKRMEAKAVMFERGLLEYKKVR